MPFASQVVSNNVENNVRAEQAGHCGYFQATSLNTDE